MVVKEINFVFAKHRFLSFKMELKIELFRHYNLIANRIYIHYHMVIKYDIYNLYNIKYDNEQLEYFNIYV